MERPLRAAAKETARQRRRLEEGPCQPGNDGDCGVDKCTASSTDEEEGQACTEGARTRATEREMVIDFFFPSGVHDVVTFEQFRACMPSALRGGVGGSGRTGAKTDSPLVAELYNDFLAHRRGAREAVRESIDGHYPPPPDELIAMSNAQLERHAEMLSARVAAAQAAYDAGLDVLRETASVLHSAPGPATVNDGPDMHALVSKGRRVVSLLDKSVQNE